MLDLDAAHERQAVAKALADLWGHGVVTGVHYKEAEAAIKASRESLAAAGLVIVPIEATEEMVKAGKDTANRHAYNAFPGSGVRQVWRAMLDARSPMQAPLAKEAP